MAPSLNLDMHTSSPEIGIWRQVVFFPDDLGKLGEGVRYEAGREGKAMKGVFLSGFLLGATGA